MKSTRFRLTELNDAEAAKKRLLKFAASALGIFAAGLLYAFFISRTGQSVPCIFRAVTGLKCPGCGSTGLCMSLLRFDIRSAWEHNRAITAMLPLGAAVAGDMSLRYILYGDKRPDRFSSAAMWFISAVLVIFGMVRNLSALRW